ncbi:Dps family protein [Testudinibacter sp. TR-2022]|uniref:Dps family protein n=1 Tax=Testudinibacter sp. TR-2022 TaxID=2585029 RepID=UPI00111AEEBD|nr:Dps family protein [Testudinibacter sp. TR-2022]TNH07554.1 DNA starvation/stationary phase protection protein [Pasteurellaceae bacterium Phil11]TNH24041.1 DNA starvation/stationary phase protection protein [Testudinibacter sp. TR-2022]TNH24074.1 DNA starvation/stationary phase protection protein [Testudinibacter sp. TR-2022]
MTTNIGLDVGKSQALAEKLNVLLANYQVFYMNVRGYHWNITGPNFFELHVKFEEIYDNLVIKIDEIAERILTLGQRPLHSFQDYLAISDIQSHTNAVTDTQTLQGTLDGFKALLVLQRDILFLAGEADDEGTASQMSDYIKEQEKLIWMLNAVSAR